MAIKENDEKITILSRRCVQIRCMKVRKVKETVLDAVEEVQEEGHVHSQTCSLIDASGADIMVRLTDGSELPKKEVPVGVSYVNEEGHTAQKVQRISRLTEETDRTITFFCRSNGSEWEKLKSNPKRAVVIFLCILLFLILLVFLIRSCGSADGKSRANSSPVVLVDEENDVDYLIRNGQVEKAKKAAMQQGADDLYERAMAAEVTKLIKDKEYDDAIQILSSWTFVADFYPDGGRVYAEREKYVGYPKNNDGYNMEVSSYNDLVDNLINSMLINGKTNRKKKKKLQKVCSLYVENAVLDTSGNWSLQNTYREIAFQRLADAGIKLDK